MKLERQGIILGSAFGAKVVLSWWFFIVAVLFGRHSLSLAFLLSFFLLVLIHELGHAVLVRHFGLRVIEINVHGLGGFCRWSGFATEYQASVIAWGGVLAQLVALVLAVLFRALAPGIALQLPPEVFQVFIWDSVLIMALNLLPIEPLDGAKAWAIIPRLTKLMRRKTAKARHVVQQVRQDQAVKAELRRLDSIQVTDEMMEEVNQWAQAELGANKPAGNEDPEKGQ